MTERIKWFPGIRAPKDPDSVLDWRWEYENWVSTGDTISAHSVVADAGLTVDTSTADSTGVVVWLSGGTSGTTYAVTVRLVTSQGRTVDRTVNFEVVDQ